MPPPFKSNKGGKKGPRQVTSKYQKKIILRPAPAPSPNASDAPSKGKAREYEEQDGEFSQDEEDDHDDSDQYGYRESLQQDRLPLAGFRISVSGCSGQKQDLLKLAEEYGAMRHSGLQEDTTHLITDQMTGAKYKIALERRMTIMTPDWLSAVREAWTSGDKVDFDQIEREYRLRPLTGVIFTLTQFASGPHKEKVKQRLMEEGGEYASRLDTLTTHLIVASQFSPRSQTPPSAKLLHATRNRKHLRPGFEVMWEGWAWEAIKFGGRREERDKIWVYESGKEEPQEDLSWVVDAPPPRQLQSTPYPHASTSAAVYEPIRRRAPTSRDLMGGGLEGRAVTTRKFTGYDNSITESFEEQAELGGANHDLANGKILKKRRKLAAPDASQGNPEQIFRALATIQSKDDGSGMVGEQLMEGNGQVFSFGQPEGIEGDQFGLPVPPPGYEDVNMVYEMKEGEVGLQRTKKSKSAIKAITSKRTISEVETAPKSIRSVTPREQQDSGMQDDSGFLDNSEETRKNQEAEDQSACSSESSQANPSIFAGLTMALMDIKAKPPQEIADHIERGGAKAVVDASEDELAKVDWIVVDFVEPPESFMNSSDPRVVSLCWIEYCLWADQVVPIMDRVLDRPIPFHCPVAGAQDLVVHFSGWNDEQTPTMHHNRRYLNAVGVSIATNFSRSCTHLILKELEDRPDLSPSSLESANNLKLSKAKEWGKQIVSMREFRQQIAKLAATATEPGEVSGERASGVVSLEEARGDAQVSRKENMNRHLEEAESLGHRGGPLQECVIYFSTKSNIDRQALADVVKDLGGTAARQYSDAVTHFVYSDPSKVRSKATDYYKELKLAKMNPNCQIVHPRWIEECGKSSTKASELDFPYTFDTRKGGQLFEAGMSMALSPTSTRVTPPVDLREDARLKSPGDERARNAVLRRSATPTTKRKSQLDFRVLGDDEAAATTESKSPTPRHRRSDSTHTEIAEPEKKTHPEFIAESSTSRPNPFSSTTISSTGGGRADVGTGESGSAQSTIRPLSAVPPRHTEEDSISKRQAYEKRKKEELLKQQTDALKLAMQIESTSVHGKNSRTRANIFGKKQNSMAQITTTSPRKNLASPTRTTSLPTLLPSSSPSRRDGEPGALHPPSSSAAQYSQSQAHTNNEVRVVFDEPAAFEARQNAIRRQKEAEEGRKRLEQEQVYESQSRRVTRSAKKGMY